MNGGVRSSPLERSNLQLSEALSVMIHSTNTAGEPTPKPSIPLLIAVAAVSPLGINMYLPSMPGMARALEVDFGTIQLTLSLYLAAMAIGQLIVGPLSDRLGRRPVLLVGLGLYVFGSLICFAAQTINVLILGRVVQAVGGCAGITLSRAIVRDLYGRNEAASMIGYVTMGMAVAPMIAPLIGGIFETYWGWRTCFAFLAGFGGIALLFAASQLYETNHDRGSGNSVRELLRGYILILRSRLFWGYTLATSFIMVAHLSFVSGASYVMIELMGRSPAEYGLYFAILPSGYILGNFATGRLAVSNGPNRLILGGLVLVLAGVGAMATLFAIDLFHPVSLFGPMFFIGLGSGLVLPNGIAGAVSVKPELAGAAAGLTGSMQVGFGAIAAPAVGAMLETSVWPLIFIMAMGSLLAFASFGLVWQRP
jgi:MFS transporter, DHA1 family, multidrug resistance protein